MADDKVEQLKQLIEDDPSDSVLHYGLGAELLRRKDYPAAAHALRKALELKPDYSAAYRELGKAMERLNMRDEAVDFYKMGLAVAQQNGDLQTAREIEVFLKRLGGA
ncbi:MAG: tetratricopeptide repeat protein [Terriglobia bacterium]